MLNKKQRQYLKTELQYLADMQEHAMNTKNEQKAKEYEIRFNQTYQLFDVMLEMDGKEIESI